MGRFKPDLHFGARPELKRIAAELRKNMTPAEERLWQELRARQLNGWKFRRQHALAFCIADFYCHQLCLVVEVDGPIHALPDRRERDRARRDGLESLGIEVIRFSNTEVLENLHVTLQRIRDVGEERREHLREIGSWRRCP